MESSAITRSGERTMNKAICVFCGSSSAVDGLYVQAARDLGTAMAERGHSLVFGGGKIGLMGEVAGAIMDGGGSVVGVIPEALKDLELALESVDELIVTDGMHERKATMARRADAFVALPGGFGTLEEITEIIAHRQLKIHPKPCVILNLDGYYDPLIAQFERGFDEGFIKEIYRNMYQVTRSVSETLDFIENFPL